MKRITFVGGLVTGLAVGIAAVTAAALHVDRDGIPGIATLHGAEADATPRGANRGERKTGAAYRHARGELAVYVPAELAVHEGRYDVVVHFHGAAKIQEENLEQARLRAVVVSVNVGAGSAPYAKAYAAPGSLDRLLAYASQSVEKSGRMPNPAPRNVALSAWSAGGAALKEILATDGDRIDAAIVADGLFSSYAPDGKEVRIEPLAPVTEFARKATRGEKLVVITHTSIPTPSYPCVSECADVILGELGLAKGPPKVTAQSYGGASTYAVEKGALHVLGFDGKGPEDHVAQARALDESYALLRDRWGD